MFRAQFLHFSQDMECQRVVLPEDSSTKQISTGASAVRADRRHQGPYIQVKEPVETTTSRSSWTVFCPIGIISFFTELFCNLIKSDLKYFLRASGSIHCRAPPAYFAFSFLSHFLFPNFFLIYIN